MTCFPSRWRWTLGRSSAVRLISSSAVPAATSMLSRTLPFTCTTSVTMSRWSMLSSGSGHGSSHTRLPVTRS